MEHSRQREGLVRTPGTSSSKARGVPALAKGSAQENQRLRETDVTELDHVVHLSSVNFSERSELSFDA